MNTKQIFNITDLGLKNKLNKDKILNNKDVNIHNF